MMERDSIMDTTHIHTVTDEALEGLMRRFAHMVAEQLAPLVAVKVEQQPAPEPKRPSRQLRGIDGIAEICQCSRSGAAKIRAAGILDAAITHVSLRVYLIDEDKARAILAERQQNKNKRNKTYGRP